MQSILWSTTADDARTLQAETSTLDDALQGRPQTDYPGAYKVLAELVRYEHTHASLDNPLMAAAIAELDARDQARQRADFTLPDLSGRTWTLRSLTNKVVLVNFCRRDARGAKRRCRPSAESVGDLWNKAW